VHVEHAQESETPMSARVGHALAHGDNVATRRTVTGGEEVGEGKGEARRWLGKPERNRSSFNQTASKTSKVTKTKENATTG
jgi:hypothetical protein